MGSNVSIITAAIAVSTCLVGVVLALLRGARLCKQIEEDLDYFPLYAKATCVPKLPQVLKQSSLGVTQTIKNHEHITCSSAIKSAPPLRELVSHFQTNGRKLHAHGVVLKILALVMCSFIVFNILFWGCLAIVFGNDSELDLASAPRTTLLIFILSFLPALFSIAAVTFINHLWVQHYASEGYKTIFRKYGRVICDVMDADEHPARLHDYPAKA